MKTSLTGTSFILAVFLLAVTGCSKTDRVNEVPGNDEAIEAMTAMALADLGNQEVYAGLAETGLYMDNDGLPPVFMVEEADLDSNDPLREKIRMHALVRCLKSIDLREAQIEEVRAALHGYRVCNESAVKRARAIYRELQASYKDKYNRIYRQYETGAITEREFKKLVLDLRIAFKRELHAMQLKEKLDQAFIKCFRGLLADLKTILSETQWIAFTGCYIQH